MLAIEEAFVQEGGLPYRVVNSAVGDLSSAAAKRYDIEAWFPSQERYREITSCSNTTDYQARRSGIRFRAGEKQLETPHTLNGTAVTDRCALAIIENFGGGGPEGFQRFGAPARGEKGEKKGRGGGAGGAKGGGFENPGGGNRSGGSNPPPPPNPVCGAG